MRTGLNIHRSQRIDIIGIETEVILSVLSTTRTDLKHVSRIPVQALYPALSMFPRRLDYLLISYQRDPARSWAFTVRSGLHSLVVEPSNHS
jgi:hypothetical protein